MKNLTLLLLLSIGMLFNIQAQDSDYSNEFELIEFVDDFGDKTGDVAIVAKSKGVFSNSATSNSCLITFTYLQEYKGGFYFDYRLFEYCSAPYAEGGKYKDAGTIKMKVNGEVYSFPVSSFCSTGLGFKKKTTKVSKEMIEVLSSVEGDVPVVITWDNSRYKFTLNTTGFKDLLSKVGYAGK